MSITGRCVYSMSILSLHKCFTDHRLSEYMIQIKSEHKDNSIYVYLDDKR